MRVLLLAEAANPELTSSALVAWNQFSGLSKTVDVHFVTELRNREAILKTGIDDSKVTFIDNRRAMHSAGKVANFLRGGTDTGWTIYTAICSLVYPLFERKVWKQFRERISNHRFDVVHRIAPITPVAPSFLAKRCSQHGVPFVLGPINGGVPWPKEFRWMRRSENDFLSMLRGLHKILPGYRATRKNAAAILAASRVAHSQLAEKYHQKTLILPENAIDPERFVRVAGDSGNFDKLKVVFVGRLVPLKGVDMLIEAAAELLEGGQLELDLVGDGPERGALEKLVAEKKLPGVKFHGWVDQKDLPRILERNLVFGFPSVREFGGGVVLEAMAMGLAPIVIDYGGPSDLVINGTGWRLPMASSELIVERLRQQLKKLVDDPQLAVQAGETARNFVLENHTWEARAKQICEVYRWVCGEIEKPDINIVSGNGGALGMDSPEGDEADSCKSPQVV